ncbi:MAG: sigma-70 family RNA polymerase sigma factor [Clostridia bacterium]|nr:sigma-70 family RNA polymerase sigma factor [Clostridia bacterium]
MLPIILNILNDDERAFVETIYVKYEKQLYIISMKYLQDHRDAQDCVHDTIALVIDSIEKFKTAQDMGYIDRLITVVCRNCALNALRVKRRKNQYEQSLVHYNYEEEKYEEIELPDYESSVDKIYVSQQNCEYLHELINRLDDKYRDVVLLKSLGFDYKAIAKMMNISEELARQRYARAKKQLWEMGGNNLYAESSR